MASIVSVGTAVPPYLMRQDEAKRLAGEHFAGRIADLGRYLAVFDNALVDQRYFTVEPEWFGAPHSLEDKNGLYLDRATELSIAAIENCLESSGVGVGEIDHFVFVSSSGIATPSLDVAVINALGLSPAVRRLPLFGLGCAGGAAGVALARSLLAGASDATVLLVAVELNSLTFQPDDFSTSNLVAASLFGDGAAAVVLRGAGRGPVDVLKSATLLSPRTDRLMGWQFVDTGFRVVFSRRVPEAIAEMMPEAVGRALDGSGVAAADVASLVFHPGGKRILEAYERVLGRTRQDFRASYDVLSRYGNMSSVTILFVLDDEMRNGRRRSGDHGLLAAFGPGFSAEVSLLRWA
ncbi:MAG: 3-oxoacyl-[acyl-carrier-protein] synthase III C-terminal domain-containing protein [Bauldia sp.]